MKKLANQLVSYLNFNGLCHCWLGGRKGIQACKKTEGWDAGVVIRVFLDKGPLNGSVFNG